MLVQAWHPHAEARCKGRQREVLESDFVGEVLGFINHAPRVVVSPALGILRDFGVREPYELRSAFAMPTHHMGRTHRGSAHTVCFRKPSSGLGYGRRRLLLRG